MGQPRKKDIQSILMLVNAPELEPQVCGSTPNGKALMSLLTGCEDWLVYSYSREGSSKYLILLQLSLYNVHSPLNKYGSVRCEQ
jgi:hypothetical protein